MNLLSEVIFLPLAGMFLILFLPKQLEKLIFGLGILFSLVTFWLSLALYNNFEAAEANFQFQQNAPWITSFNITYSVGIDGIALVLILLTTFLSLLALFYSSQTITSRKKEFVCSVLFLETAMLGTFAALDIFLFYVFWEAMLLPMYLLIGIFGGPKRIYATLKFFIYTMVGSVLMLAAVLIIYWMHHQQFGFYSTAIQDLLKIKLLLPLQILFFSAFLLAFAIKIPMFPFHTWLPDAHVEAPTAGSVLLAGILLKMGGFGLIRWAIPLFPEAAILFSPYLGWLGVIGIVYGAYVALAQQDMKKLIAYSSVSHMGFVVLGIASLSVVGLQGAVFQMIAHGISTGSLFFLVGMLYERRHTRMLVDFGGLAKVTPKLATAFVVISFASIGLPGLCGFVGEFLVLSGSFQAVSMKHPVWMVGVSVIGIILGAIYMLNLVQALFFGEVKFEENRKLKDLKWYEGLTLAVPLILVVWLGIKPNSILSLITPATQQLAVRIQHVQVGALK